MSVMARRPFVRWAVPAGIVVAVLGAGALVSTSAGASPSLPPRSPAQLLVDVQTAQLDGASGTVVERADLGLPALPDSIGGDGSANLNTLITGSHTLRVWYSGPDKARVALLGALGESDIIRNGSDLWTWSSSANTATHQVLRDDAKARAANPSGIPATPQEAADKVLAALDPTTSVTLGKTTTVARRSAYQLVLAPRDSRSLVARVTIAVDSQKHIPLQVQVFAKGHSAPAFRIGFDQVNFSRPDASRFQFTPPPGAKVTESGSGTGTGTEKATPEQGSPAATDTRSAVIGKGWTTVFVTKAPQTPSSSSGSDRRSTAGQLDAILGALPRVSGAWGSGRLLQARLFSALITDDGRVLVGAVTGQQLLVAAADPAAALK